jgi:hypothetical protein
VQTTQQPIQAITQLSATQAFEIWETAYRADPAGFYTAEETAAMEVATVSEERAIHLIALLRQVTAAIKVSATQPPLPGQHWPEQGGTYIGISSAEGDKPMHHLVVLDDKPANRMNWKDAMTWADSLGNGARLPTQLEALFAWTTSPETFEDAWYWTGTQYSRSSAFAQVFETGYSRWYYKDNEFRVRPVRGLALHTFAPLTAIAEGDSGEKNLVAAQAAA